MQPTHTALVAFVLALALGFAACAERHVRGGGQPGQGSRGAPSSANAVLEGSYWRAIQLAGLTVPTQDDSRNRALVPGGAAGY